MPVGLVTDTDFDTELARFTPRSVKNDVVPSSDAVIEPLPTKGRNTGDNNVPESLRKIIGETAVIDGRASAIQLAKEFGISSSSVSAYAKGATSTASYNSPSKEIIQHINQSRQRSIKRAGKTLNAALGAITQEKLDYTDAKDLSVVAKNMSAIIKDLEPQATPGTDENTRAQPQFVIFAPSFRAENTFESITVNE